MLNVMEVIPGVHLEESLLVAFVDCGHQGHDTALAHHNDPGSNGFTFGVDRYQRSCELLKDPLEMHGFRVWSKGAGLRASRDDVELHFATARTADVESGFSFDRTTESRIEAGRFNSLVQPPLDGLSESDFPSRQIVHTVWSGNTTRGLIAVNVGRLIADGAESVGWEVVRRIDRDGEYAPSAEATVVRESRAYTDQPEPELVLDVVDGIDESTSAEQK